MCIRDSENAEAPGKAADRAMVAQQINLALKSLTPREEKVIRLRFEMCIRDSPWAWPRTAAWPPCWSAWA